MEIQINNNWKVGSTEKQWIIYKKVSETRWLPYMFFTDIQALCSNLLELNLRETQAEDIKALRDEIKAFRIWLNQSHFIKEIETR